MRAGLMREILVFKEKVEEKTSSGFVRKGYKPVFRCKARKLKLALASDKDGINAMEQFIGTTLEFQTRFYPDIKESQRVEYMRNEYEIKLLNYRREDNSYTITLTKINE